MRSKSIDKEQGCWSPYLFVPFVAFNILDPRAPKRHKMGGKRDRLINVLTDARQNSLFTINYISRLLCLPLPFPFNRHKNTEN